MEEIIRRLPGSFEDPARTEMLIMREWLVTNGLGGFASGTVSGAVTRRYHGLLISALPAPLGRVVMLNHISEQISVQDGPDIFLGADEHAENVWEIPAAGFLTEFRLENGLPVWRYEIDGLVFEKSLHMLYMQNTVHITYKYISGTNQLKFKIHPSLHFRPHDAPVNGLLEEPYKLSIIGDRLEVAAQPALPVLRMKFFGEKTSFTATGGSTREIFYRIENERGYESRGLLWNPGYFRAIMQPGHAVTFVASTEPWTTILALSPPEAIIAERERRIRLLSVADPKVQTGMAGELLLAADQFIITPAGRVEDSARARAAGDEIRTVIAGYHWFTDWGRDTMISLEGLTLSTGRYNEAGWILRTFAHYVKDGLIPNLFPEGEKEGLYHTADATLWFFHALNRYIEVTRDFRTLDIVMPKLLEIFDFHMRGTHFGIGVDHADGLLRQGQMGYQLTWMDAKVEDWVVTPRRGKPVEINALWYNALRNLEVWLRESGDTDKAAQVAEQSDKVRISFNEKFWYEEGAYLYDVIDGEFGNDNALRPNQILAFSLEYPVLDRSRWESVLNITKDKLVTPVGLRSLAPGFPDYKAKYFGDIRARDAAYHQGTVWAWLIGPFIDAYIKVYPDDISGASKYLEGFHSHLNDACIGSISEIFDAEQPFTPRGCLAQAWSVAEVLRCLLKLGHNF